ncbi:MAG: hypothetical protein K2H94_04915 [Duncaniella sp.]|nr:hypothetical protein [Duncaniella sp.]
MSKSRRVSIMVHKIIVFSTLLVVLVTGFFFSADRPYSADDIIYQFVCEDTLAHDNIRYVDSFGDLVKSQTLHYFNTNGRTPVHVLVQSYIGLWGPMAYAISNALVLVLFVCLLVRYVFPRQMGNALVWAVLSAVVLLSFPSSMGAGLGPWFGVSLSLNYLWPGCLFMAMLLVWRRCHSERNISLCKTLSIALLSFFAGWSNEAYSVPLSGAVFIYFLLSRSYPRGVSRTMAFSLWTGTLLLCVSPGALSRLGGQKSGGMYLLLSGLLDCYSGVLWFWLMLVAVLILKLSGRISFAGIYRRDPVVTLALIVAVLFSVVAHSLPRSLTVVELLSFITLCNVLRLGFPKISSLSEKWSTVASISILVCLAGLLFLINGDNQRARRAYAEEMAELCASPDGVYMSRPVDHCTLTKAFVDDYARHLIPAHYSAFPLMYSLGCDDKLPMELSPREYQGVILGEGDLFEPQSRVEGSAGLYEGDDYFFAPYNKVYEGKGFIAHFDGVDFKRDMSLLHKLIYTIMGNKKAPKQLDSFVLSTRNGNYIVCPKILSVPSEIDLIDLETPN